MGFGKAKYGSGQQFTKSVKLKSGDQGQAASIDVRILPPMHSRAETGEWATYIGTHYGYKGVNSRDPNKPSYRPFRCIFDQDYRTKLVRQDCPECDLIAEYEEKKEAAIVAAKAQGHSDDEVKEIIKPISSFLSDHNCDRKWHMHVKLTTGEFATLQISHKTKKMLEDKITTLMTEEGIDALDLDQGVWFRFTRTGKGVATQDTVDIVQESVKDPTTGRISKTTKLAPLTAEEQTQALSKCQDLVTLVKSISYAQIKLLTECSGDPEDVDDILAMGQKKESSPPPQKSAAPVAPVAPVAAAPKPEAAPESQASVQAALIEQLTAQLAAAKQAAPTPAVHALKVPVGAVDVISDEVKPEEPKPATNPDESLPLDRQAFMSRFKRGTAK